MKINRNTLKELILEEMNKMEEQEIPPVIKAPPKNSSAPAADKEEPADELPTDVERNLKIGFATKFDELVKQNINNQKEVNAFLKAMLDLLESAEPEMVVRALRGALADRSKASE